MRTLLLEKQEATVSKVVTVMFTATPVLPWLTAKKASTRVIALTYCYIIPVNTASLHDTD